MECNNCRVKELTFEFKVIGNANLAMMPGILQHLKRREIIVEMKAENFVVKEVEVRDFLDFCIDHMDVNDVTFKVTNQDWKPIADINAILDTQWIDEVIKREQLICYYQPIVDINEEIFAYEMLARFQNADGTLIYPNKIFAAARERGRLYAIDRLCRMTAVRHAASLGNKKAFINFIPTSIYSPEFCLQSTTALAKELGVNPANLVFEVVESEKVEDVKHLMEILSYYREKGFQYALDDVGEGYSTMEMLGDIKPKYMKLDMKYVQGVAKDIDKQQVALKFLKKAQEVKSIPLAEGIEEKEDFEWLKEMGYQLFQGYFFGKPSPNPI